MSKKKPQPTQGFSAFTIYHNGKARSILTDISLTPAFDPSQHQGKIPFTLLPKKALWDTGATNSVLSQETVNQLNLTPIGTAVSQHAGGTSQDNTYLINMFLPNKVAIVGVVVSENNKINGQNFHVIIGMDIITQGDFSITNAGGLTCMSFRFPSIATHDYVWHAERIRFSGTDRYSSCPCGKLDTKGKPIKFHLCHGVTL